MENFGGKIRLIMWKKGVVFLVLSLEAFTSVKRRALRPLIAGPEKEEWKRVHPCNAAVGAHIRVSPFPGRSRLALCPPPAPLSARTLGFPPFPWRSTSPPRFEEWVRRAHPGSKSRFDEPPC